LVRERCVQRRHVEATWELPGVVVSRPCHHRVEGSHSKPTSLLDTEHVQ
jgi:hypothetical protein